jgi:hypothetical protein
MLSLIAAPEEMGSPGPARPTLDVGVRRACQCAQTSRPRDFRLRGLPLAVGHDPGG